MRTSATCALLLAVLLSACARASDDELLQGKACAADADCLGGYVCDTAASVCVRAVAAGAIGEVTGRAGSDGGPGASGAGGTNLPVGGSGGESTTGDGPDTGGAAGSDGLACDTSCSDAACVGSACLPSWLPLAGAPVELSARSKPAFAVGNGKLFVWGGVDAAGVDLNSGAIYDLAQDTWQVTTLTETTPSPRTLANAAWTGSAFLVWGGRLSSGASDYRSGAVYDPTTGVWTSMPTAGNPRSASILLSYDGEVLSWGGWNKSGGVLENSQRYSGGSNKWNATAADLLNKREHVGWTTRGARLYLLGGRSDTGALLADSFVYDMSTLAWSSLQSLPAGRYGSFTAHDGSELFTWGGRDLEATHADGLVMDGALWMPVSGEAAPSARWAPHRQSGWSCALDGDRVAIVGGHDVNGLPQLDGGVYARTADAWTAVPASGEAHEWGVGACIDGTLVLWGGTHDGVASANGEKIAP